MAVSGTLNLMKHQMVLSCDFRAVWKIGPNTLRPTLFD